MSDCRVCGTPLTPFMSFGQMPIANGFLLEDQFADEYFYEMQVCICGECGMFQLYETPDSTKLFHGEYAYYASNSKPMLAHFKKLADRLIAEELADDDAFIVEIGSNDGVMLRNFHEAGIKHLGIEPSGNVAQVAIDQGMTVQVSYFSEDVAKDVVAREGQADVIAGANVIAHIPVFNSVAAGVKALLKPDGIFVFENAYLGDILELGSYDQFYDEHVLTFCATSVNTCYGRHGLELVDLEHLDIHGGSMRYTVAHKGARPVSEAVKKQLAWEAEKGLTNPKTWDAFRTHLEDNKVELMSILTRLKDEGKRVAGYGATAKSTTVMNYCGITPDLVEFIQDITPAKQHKFTPGVHVPVKPRDYFVENYPDYTIHFAWNFADSIEKIEEDYTKQGGKWIYFVPKVRIK